MIGLLNAMRSVRGFLIAASILAAAYAIASALGLRDQTAFLSGTYIGDARTSTLRGTLYLALYVGWTVVVPILIIASGVQVFTARMVRQSASTTNADTRASHQSG